MQKIILICVLSIVGTICVNGERVELRVSFRDLPKLDPFGGYPDPYATMYYSRVKLDPFGRVGQTEALDDVREGRFPEIFYFDYPVTGSEQRLKIDLNDKDYNEDDDIGYAEFTLSEVMESKGLEVEKHLIPIGNGFLRIKATFSNVTTARTSADHGMTSS